MMRYSSIARLSHNIYKEFGVQRMFTFSSQILKRPISSSLFSRHYPCSFLMKNVPKRKVHTTTSTTTTTTTISHSDSSSTLSHETHPNKESTNNSTHNPNPTYTIREQPLGTLRPLKIITIGAGVSGINVIRSIKQNTRNTTLTTYDKNPEIGGTWYENRYPGCASDDPSHNYQYSHTPNPGWSSLFSPAGEIQAYLLGVCEKWGLRERIRLGHEVVHARWVEGDAQWVLRVMEVVTGECFEDRCDVLVDASGIFNDWKWPDIKGLHTFKGDLVHSANWRKDFDHKNKRVAVIGNGASGVQLVPSLQPDVKELVHFVRTKTWISPKSKAVEHVHKYELDLESRFTPDQIKKFKDDPEKYLLFLKAIEALANQRFKTIIHNSPEAHEARRTISTYMATALSSTPSLIPLLTPDFPVGTRRITPGIGYLNALTQPNVRVITNPISHIVEEGIVLSDGEMVPLDAIVCATGFNCSFVPRFPMVGTMGDLRERWGNAAVGEGEGDGCEAYMSCLVPGMPNYFTFLGPNGPLAHGAIPIISEQLTSYLLKILKKIQLQHITSFRISPQAVREYSEHIAAFMPRTVWANGEARSWYRNGMEKGRVLALHPGSQAHFFHMLEGGRWEDFLWGYAGGERGNRFAYLGNGFSTREGEEEGSDSTWYWGEAEEVEKMVVEEVEVEKTTF